ncbi:MAG: chromosome segregation protein SMC [Oscillospiraceae bacterium]
MRLRKLEIQGFKSFPDKTELTFERPITAVVGPNGSGKSNIADAVRWVLGEQSSKTLRGGKMEDVIFGGTQSRKPVGYAHVQLVIDNSDQQLSGQPEELTVSRRLYRSGESEYRIGGTMVRLKDVHQLFMDTGLGRDGYSIIGQGKISEIVSAKATQRREIFEEAAGISKFRYRKEEAERRLAQAEENLVRLRDILVELEDRVGSLKEQSDKAKEFLAYSEEKKSLEISLWMQGLDHLKEQLAAQEDKLYLAKNRYEALERESEEHQREIEAAYLKVQSLGSEVEEKRAAVKAMEEQIAAHQAQVAVLQNDIHHNRQSIAGVEEELAASGLGSDALKARVREKEQELEEAKKELAALSSKLEAAEERLVQQREQVAKVHQELEALQVRRDSVQQALQEAKLFLASSGTVLAESTARLDALRQSSGAYDKAVTELEEAIAECNAQRAEEEEKIQGLENSKRGYQLKGESRKKSLQELLDNIQDLQHKAQDARRRAKLLEDMEKSMEGFAGSVKYILGQAEKGAIGGIIGPVSTLLSTKDEYTLAIETALGAAMQNIVVEDDRIAKRAIGMLQSAKAGRATFLPLNTVKGSRSPNVSAMEQQEGYIGIASDLVQAEPRLQKVVEQLLGRVCVAEDLDCANQIAKAGGYSLRVVTLDGQVINAGGSFTGGSSARGTGALGRRREIERLQKRAQELEKQAVELEPARKSLTEELSAVEAAISGIDGEIKTAQEEMVRLQATTEQLRKNLESARQNRILARQEVETLTTRLENLRDEEVTAERLVEELEQQLSSLEEQVNSVRSRQEMLAVGAQAAADALAEQRMLRLTAEKDTQLLAQELEQAHSTLENAGLRAQELASRKEALERENREILAKIQELGNRMEREALEKAQLEEKISALIVQRNEMEKQITALHAADRATAAQKEEVGRELTALEARQHSLQSDYDAIISKLWNEYELTRTQAMELVVELPSKERAQRRLSELRSKIKALGSVNVAAIEEYRQVGERYEFLSRQVADVEQSKKQLLELISDLTQEMRTLFTDTFQRVSHHFSQIFVELFGGGKAELTLTEEEDVLESGVEIYVQPPGKIIKNLSLLSGGEQAFVAIAIYFAILKVRPSPFCVLDEIEAALDDVNVVKFANYLRRMSASTQFIAITHRRGTMEEADVLYGVTMQEEGVSKLLELEVEEVEATLGIS